MSMSSLLLMGLASVASAAVPVNSRTMTYWASATNICSDPHRKQMDCAACCAVNRTDPARKYCCAARNNTPGSADWETRLQTVLKHKDNVTGLIPCVHAIGPGGKLVPTGDNYPNFAPYFPRFKAMGLKLYAFLGNIGGQSSLVAAMNRRKDFFAECVAMAKLHGYDGFSSDEELRGGVSEGSWKALEKFAPSYMDFMNDFADALHAENLKLTVFVAGCCGWADPNTTRALGHCQGAIATHDFVGASCNDWKNSRVDWVISGATYSGTLRDGPWNPDGVAGLKAIAGAAAAAIGVPKYGIGMKGGFAYNGTDTPPFGDEERSVIDWWHKLGVQHVAKFADEPTTQTEWDAWGYHLHGPSYVTPEYV